MRDFRLGTGRKFVGSAELRVDEISSMRPAIMIRF